MEPRRARGDNPTDGFDLGLRNKNLTVPGLDSLVY